MPIRIAERSVITPEFKEALVALSIERLKQIRAMMLCKTGAQLACYQQEMTPTIVRLGRIARDPAGALDMVITRLRGLPYTRFEVMPLDRHPHIQFLVGTTRNVEIEFRRRIYDMGPYSVRIPFSRIIGLPQTVDVFEEYGEAQGDTWHFIPLNAPEGTEYRTPHHYGRWPVYSRTCWGEFNGMIRDLADGCDIPELFRTIFIYLSRYNDNSALRGHLGNSVEFRWSVARPVTAPPSPEPARVRR